jgi:hypothetical protein
VTIQGASGGYRRRGEEEERREGKGGAEEGDVGRARMMGCIFECACTTAEFMRVLRFTTDTPSPPPLPHHHHSLARYVDAMDGCSHKEEYCSPSTPASGYVPPAAANNKSQVPFCDYIAYTDAIEKLQFAAKAQQKAQQQAQAAAANGQAAPPGGRDGSEWVEGGAGQKGFFLVVGIRRPHLTFRAPKVYSDMYAGSSHVAMPAHPTLHESIEPIAWTAFAGLGGNDPYKVTDTEEVAVHSCAYTHILIVLC